MRIYACGCSFTHGDELENPEKSAWPIRLAEMLTASINNDAVNGGTNARTVYRTIKNTQDEYDLYLIAWTDYSRFTFYKNNNNFEVNFNSNLEHALYRNEKFYTDWGKTLYKHWYNELYAFKIWLQQIIQLQKVLENKNYLMINTTENNLSRWVAPKEKFIDSVRDLINFNLLSDKQIFDEYDEIQYYISLIDISKFYQWNEFYISKLCRNFPCGPGGHILEEGHDQLSNLIHQHICSR
jgi:hypothetical protein